jgi:Rrf2 family protein
MNITAKTEYACIAIVELAIQIDADAPLCIKEIADKHGIPPRFLVQILLQLKNAGFVNSTRGAAGGYRLAVDPATISIGDVMEAVEGKSATISSNANNDTRVCRHLNRLWQELSDELTARLHETSVADLAAAVQHSNQNMYYI